MNYSRNWQFCIWSCSQWCCDWPMYLHRSWAPFPLWLHRLLGYSKCADACFTGLLFHQLCYCSEVWLHSCFQSWCYLTFGFENLNTTTYFAIPLDFGHSISNYLVKGDGSWTCYFQVEFGFCRPSSLLWHCLRNSMHRYLSFCFGLSIWSTSLWRSLSSYWCHVGSLSSFTFEFIRFEFARSTPSLNQISYILNVGSPAGWRSSGSTFNSNYWEQPTLASSPAFTVSPFEIANWLL